MSLVTDESDEDTMALLRAFSKLGDVRMTKKMFYLRRKLEHPLVVRDPDSARSVDEFELLLRPLAIGQSSMMNNQLQPYKKKGMDPQDSNKDRTPRSTIYEYLRTMQQEQVPVTVRHANIMLAAYVRAMRLKRAKGR